MCGFVGVIRGAGRGVRREEFSRASAFIARRGPDGTGIFIDGEIGLAATRLAIQGGREGDQPLRSADGRFVLAYNGELFASHRRAIRGTLRAEGAGEVRAVSDSALLLAWLAHRFDERAAGEPVPASAFEILRGGMYAFAFVDLSTREVFLHTDGQIKPLHVAARPDAGEVWFASTPAALWATIGGPRAIDVEEWAFRLVCPDGRRPLLRISTGVEEVRDRVLVADAAEPGRVREATLAGRMPRTPAGSPELDEVREAFEEAAREAAETSGPVSLFLSGGLDSAAVAAWCGRGDVLALTGRFDPVGGPFDESADAAAVAASAGLRHEIVSLSDADLLDDLSDVVSALEDPSGGPGSLSIHRMAHRARAHGRVVLSGTGGDERFAGYARIALALGREGAWTKGYEGLSLRMNRAGADPRRRWLAAVDRSDDLVPFLDPAFAATLPLAAARQAVFDVAFPAGDGPEAPPPARALADAEIATSLRMLLRVEDRITMSLGLESRPVACLGRVPSTAARLNEGALVGVDGEGKRSLRAALEGRIPNVVRQRHEKRGFPTPFHRAATGAGRAAALAILEDRRFRERGYWNVAACRRLLDEARPAHDRALFSVLLHETFARLFVDGDALRSVPAGDLP